MKSTIRAVFMAGCLLSSGGISMASAEPSVDSGKKLFNDAGLGTNGKTCNDCHPNGKGIEKAAGNKDLDKIVNGCIAQALQGKPLNPLSTEMRSIILYINGLTGGKKQGS